MFCRLRGECVEKSPAVKRAEKLVHQIEDVKEKLQHDLAVSYNPLLVFFFLSTSLHISNKHFSVNMAL